MKIGMNLSIDVTKLHKDKLFKGKNSAKYANLTIFIDTEKKDKYGNHASVCEEQSKEERESGENKHYVGNGKIFWTDGISKNDSQREQTRQSAHPPKDDFDDEIPF